MGSHDLIGPFNGGWGQQPYSTSAIPLREMPGACPHCSTETSATFHGGPCPRVRAIEYHPDGSVKRIEYHQEAQTDA